MSQLRDNDHSRNHERRESRSSKVRALEDLGSELLVQQDALVSRHIELRYKSVRASEFSNQICALREQRVYLLSDSTEAVKHARRDTLARRPGPVLGIDTDSADQWCLQIEQQREHLRDDIYTLPQARERFSRQADELDEEIQTIRRTVAEVHAESKRLKKGMEKAQNQQ